MQYRKLFAWGLAALAGLLGGSARADDAAIIAKLQQSLDKYVGERSAVEGNSGVSMAVDRGGRPIITLFSGTDGRTRNLPIGPNTLFQIGSNTKHFTAALMLKLEADHKLNLDQTIGDWLPQYPAWRDVKLRSLLNMTSGIANYSETVNIGRLVATDINHQFSPQRLIAAVNPNNGKNFPVEKGWFYSNTNNILAALVIEAASQMSYKQALETLLLRPLRLRDTYYSNGAYPAAVLAREPRGLYENAACLLYQNEPCTRSTLAPLIGRDMRTENLSWAGAAGAMVSNPKDLAAWIRALFQVRVFPQAQLDEMTSVVSQHTGLPIADVSATEPKAFGLDLGRLYVPELGGAFWFYQGTTLGFRAIFAYWPQNDLVITAFTNSQPPDGEDKFAASVIGPAFAVVTTGNN